MIAQQSQLSWIEHFHRANGGENHPVEEFLFLPS
jgi:hypothetical protein